jgi:predicted dehydrogenase
MINIAVIGCGRWGPNHIRNFISLPNCRLVAAIDIDKSCLSHISKMFPGIHVEHDYRRVLEDPGVDAVVVSTPTCTHYSIVRHALLAGKHILCEKPLCETSLQAKELIELADESKLTLMVGHVFLFNPGILKLKAILDEGALGTLHYMSSTRTNLGPIRTDVNAAFDLASHDVSIFNWLVGSYPELASAFGGSFLQADVEDVVFISLKYPGNVVGHIMASWLDPKKVRQMSIVGSEKMVTWDDLEISSPIAIYDKGANAEYEYKNFGEFLRIKMWDGDVRLPKVNFEEPLKAQNLHFLEAIENGGKIERSGGEFSLGVVSVLEAIVSSLKRDGRPVRVSQ